MSGQEAERISKYLENNDVCLPSNNVWLNSCIHWFRTHDDLAGIYTSVDHYVLIQWLLADLADVQNPCLPSVPKEGKTLLNGKYNVQINWMRDIAQSSYTQLQNMQNNNRECESNEFVSADEPKKQSWEPNPKRVLMMEITDGVKTMKAMEYSPIPRLVEPFLPGLKVCLKGSIECRNGILFLTNNNVTILGGEVEELHDLNSKEMILSKCLNITPNQNQNNGMNGQENRSNNVTSVSSYTRHTDSSHRSDSVSDINNRPPMVQQPSTQSRPVSTAEPDRDMFMDDDSDDIFLQLPEEMFNSSANNVSTDLSKSNTVNSQRKQENQVPTSKAPLRLSNRPKLFPFLEETREPNANSAPNNISIEKIDLTSSRVISEVPKATASSGERLHSGLERDFGADQSSFRTGSFSNVSTPNDSTQKKSAHFIEDVNQDSSDCVLVEDKLFPKFVMTKVKVQEITYLKIRNKKWTCTAKAVVDGSSKEISFSDHVLEKLFDVTALELEALKEEMKSNGALKQKVSAILKTGQTRIRTLDCIMTLEHSAEDCVPSVASIDL